MCIHVNVPAHGNVPTLVKNTVTYDKVFRFLSNKNKQWAILVNKDEPLWRKNLVIFIPKA